MEVRIGDVACKAIYLGDILVWAIEDTGEYLNGKWVNSLAWDNEKTWE